MEHHGKQLCVRSCGYSLEHTTGGIATACDGRAGGFGTVGGDGGGTQPGSTAFALRVRARKAALLTVYLTRAVESPDPA